ncbi:MAG: PQQ-like beta-propeller repeat protein [Spirochaetales bacterium]|nr:PQQ-like beta-propeller repeat protein [Spirochaetales bacterium]
MILKIDRYRIRFIQHLLFILLFFNGVCFSEDNTDSFNWPRFRGSHGNGISDCKVWDPSLIRENMNFRWTIDVGAGYSNVAIKGTHLFTLGNKKKQDTVYCIDSDSGVIRWEYSYSCPTRGFYPGTRATPIIDEDRLYTMSREGHVFCFDTRSGNVIWKKHVVKDFHAEIPIWGFSGSPVIRGNILYLNACRFGIALDKRNGKTVWSSPEGKAGYATPVFCTLDQTDSLLFFGHDALYAVEASTGSLLWNYSWETEWGANTADPLVFGNHVFISSHYGMGSVCLEIKGNTPSLCWKLEKVSSHFPGFIYSRGFIYGNDGTAGKGRYCCINAETGNVMWSASLGFGTLTATDKHLIFLTELGYLSVAEINTSTYKVIAKTRIKGGIFFTEPVLCSGFLFIRERRGMLSCIDLRKQK